MTPHTVPYHNDHEFLTLVPLPLLHIYDATSHCSLRMEARKDLTTKSHGSKVSTLLLLRSGKVCLEPLSAPPLP